MTNFEKLQKEVFTQSVTSNYVGDAANTIISQALFGSPTLAQELITIMPNIKYKLNIPNHNFGTVIQAYASAYSDTPTGTYTETVLQPTDLMVNWTLDPKTYEQTFMAARMMAGAQNSEPPADFMSFLVNQLSLKASTEIDGNIWMGNHTGTTTELSGKTLFDGIVRKIDVSTSRIKVANTTLTSSNVIAEMTKVYNAIITGATMQRGDVSIYCSPAIAGLYQQANATAIIASYYTKDYPLQFLNLPMKVCPGLATNVMVCGSKQNLFFGTDIVSDINEVNVIDMRKTTNDYKIKFRADFKAGTQIVNSGEIVLYA